VNPRVESIRRALRRAALGASLGVTYAMAATPVSLVIDGPDVINAAAQRRVDYDAHVVYDDGSAAPANDISWSVSSAPDGRAADFLLRTRRNSLYALRAGTVTVTASTNNGAELIASKSVGILNGAPAEGSVAVDCPADPGILADGETDLFPVGPMGDSLPVCGSQVALASQAFNRVEVVDVATGAVVRAWPLAAKPRKLVRSGDYLFATLEAAAGARIDLRSSDVVYFAIPRASGVALAATEPGKVAYIAGTTLHQVAVAEPRVTGTVELYNAVPTPEYAAYDPYRHMLYVSDRYFSPVTVARYYHDDWLQGGDNFGWANSMFTGGTLGNGLALSPNGNELLVPTAAGNASPTSVSDFKATLFPQSYGVFEVGAYPAGASFRFDGARLAAANDLSDVVLFDPRTHVETGRWIFPRNLAFNCGTPFLDQVNWSPLGRNLFVASLCTGEDWAIGFTSMPAPTALFVKKSGRGDGRITATPGVIDCGFNCVDGFAPGTQVSLTAAVDPYSVLDGWIGCDSASVTRCDVTLDSARTVTARFRAKQSVSWDPFYVGNGGGRFGAVLAVRAVATSGLPATVAVDAASVEVCRWAAGELTILRPGRCTVTATQDGNAEFAPAPPIHVTYDVPREFTSVSFFAEQARVVEGETATLFASLQGGLLPVTGTVSFVESGQVVCADVPLVGGSARCTTPPLQGGFHVFGLDYPGDEFFYGLGLTVYNDVKVDTLAVEPLSLDFGGQSTSTQSEPKRVTVRNLTNHAVMLPTIIAADPFRSTTDCAGVLPSGATCHVDVVFAPFTTPVFGPYHFFTNAYNQGVSIAPPSMPGFEVAFRGTSEHSFTRHYYRSILRREPEASGEAYWDGEAQRIADLGGAVSEAWFAMAMTFFATPEYASLGRSDAAFLEDLYRTFFNRPSDPAGLVYWLGQMAGGMSRDGVLPSFMLSTEFQLFTLNAFGVQSLHREVDVVVDYYRGLLLRLPDDGGLRYWAGRFRAALCGPSPAVAVKAEADAISAAFLGGTEYQARARTNEQFVADLYNTFLRRGEDLAGAPYWQSQLDTGAMTRDQVRRSFLQSPEFANRVNALVAQGCLS
jgi:DNA-binding beta-propeller fold protein YncE